MRIKNQPGCLTWPAILATVITFFAVSWNVFNSGQGLFSPGPLNAQPGAPLGNISSHAQLSQTCDQCHTAPWDADFMQDRCMRCHTDIQLELADAHKLHGILLGQQEVLACGDCHAEHRGPRASLTDVTLNNFPHDQLGFATSSHQKIPDGSPFICQTCHVNGYKTFKTSDCADCHIRLNRTFMVSHLSAYAADCRACHDGKESINKKFQHPQTAFSPVGAHSELACARCHNGSRLLTDFKTVRTKCADCHLKDNPHGEKLGTVCEDCHNQQSWKDAHFDHALSGFVLTGAHEKVACEKCHSTPGQFKNTPTTCIGCHQKDDKHNGSEGAVCENCHTTLNWKTSTFNHDDVFKLVGAHTGATCAQCHTTPLQFKDAPTTCFGCHQKDDKHNGSEGTACETCHTLSSWKPSTFNHDSAIFKLTGAHINVVCSRCHTMPNVFNGAPTACVACHLNDDAHKGSLGPSCISCHFTSAWKPSSFNHNNTAFKLTGLHASVQCAQCHINGVFKATPMNCVSCHQKDDKHAGGEGTSCENCHTSAGWKSSTFNHSTVFALTGAHASLVCDKCHTTPFKFDHTPATCFGCHQSKDFHAGTEGTTCENCHATSSWKPSLFDHNQSAFPLTGAHKNQACSACHTNGGIFKGTPSTCVSCHAEPTYHAGLFGTNCATCHSPASWSATYTGPHTFPMQHGGANGTCATCHPSTLTQWTCFNCHNQAQTTTQHAQKGINDITNCMLCHPAGKKP